MEKLDLNTPDLTQDNIDKIAELFPDVVTETLDDDGNIRRSIDFDALRDDLGGDAVSGQRERYQFTWPGKRAAKAEARTPFDGTLRPCPEKSVDWDTTQNIYIEGDNLQALKLMRETYAGKVKLIYIDPPYNTGHDFIYDDDFAQTRGEYDAESGDYDEEGGRLVANPESNGRFHSDWCSMIYPRLLLARDLLTDDGAIFISIDDNELDNLIKLGNEVFAENNFVACLTRKALHTVRNSSKDFNKNTDYVLVWLKDRHFYDADKRLWFRQRGDKSENYPFDDKDGKGRYKLDPIYARNYMEPYTFTFNNGIVWEAPQGSYPRYSVDTLRRMDDENELVFSPTGNVSAKRYLARVQVGQPPDALLRTEKVGYNSNGTKELAQALGIDKVFSQPKPIELIGYLLSLVPSEDSIVVDFFSGSASTAEAVIRLNVDTDGNRKFILVQLPALCEAGSNAEQAGFATLCDIGEERIRRAGRKIAEEVEEANRQLKIGEDPKPVPDIGFRVFRVDSSNFRDTYEEPGDVDQSQLSLYVDNLKEGRTPEDLLFQVLPKFRIPYSAKVEKRDVCGKEVFLVEDGQLVACFDAEVGVGTIEEIAKAKPLYAVFRDASLADDATEANFEELFKTYSPDTIRRVI